MIQNTGFSQNIKPINKIGFGGVISKELIVKLETLAANNRKISNGWGGNRVVLNEARVSDSFIRAQKETDGFVINLQNAETGETLIARTKLCENAVGHKINGFGEKYGIGSNIIQSYLNIKDTTAQITEALKNLKI